MASGEPEGQKVLVLSDMKHKDIVFPKDSVIYFRKNFLEDDEDAFRIFSYIVVDPAQGLEVEIPYTRIESWAMNGSFRYA